MKQSNIGSFTIPEIQELLHVAKVTAYEISKLPELDRQLVAGQYRITKSNFWKWYNSQTHYQVFEEELVRKDYFSSRDVAKMFGWTVDGAAQFLKKKRLVADVSGFRCYVRKADFIDWYIHQFRYNSADPRLPPKEITPAYDIYGVRGLLGVRSNSSVYRICKREQLAIFRVEGRTLVEKESFDNWYFNQKEYPRKEKKHGLDHKKKR